MFSWMVLRKVPSIRQVKEVALLRCRGVLRTCKDIRTISQYRRMAEAANVFKYLISGIILAHSQPWSWVNAAWLTNAILRNPTSPSTSLPNAMDR
jgi:hypothetical protein